MIFASECFLWTFSRLAFNLFSLWLLSHSCAPHSHPSLAKACDKFRREIFQPTTDRLREMEDTDSGQSLADAKGSLGSCTGVLSSVGGYVVVVYAQL